MLHWGELSVAKHYVFHLTVQSTKLNKNENFVQCLLSREPKVYLFWPINDELVLWAAKWIQNVLVFHLLVG